MALSKSIDSETGNIGYTDNSTYTDNEYNE